MDLETVDQNQAEKKMGQAEKVVERMGAVLRPICEEMGRHHSGEMVFTT